MSFDDLIEILRSRGMGSKVWIERVHEVPLTDNQYLLSRSASGWLLSYYERGRPDPVQDGLVDEAEACAAVLDRLGPVAPPPPPPAGTLDPTPFARKDVTTWTV
ncbi:hypothetical protein K8Z61_07950 [Nocardioides sp. TRM66260-LWL]|uniref:hypothetical protein n=1 Tax=Nocardioides sp. TRM66260-LWL TaxID=2874478 RepID=UPI001CC58CB6|nr:hypothetical protein [Nocardioides sp. TRM66260-LWL]MBZ5734427.1 hypothetical protein [Nocardioides sp. TRM66260-LWL]